MYSIRFYKVCNFKFLLPTLATTICNKKSYRKITVDQPLVLLCCVVITIRSGS